MSVITISRQFGAGGKTLGEMVSEKLNYTFVDNDIIQMVAKQAKVSTNWVESIEKEAGGAMEKLALKRTRVVMSSGGLEPVADAGIGEHSVFAAALITALKENKGIIDGTQLFERVRNPVMSNADQTPEYADIHRAGHDGGDFIFVRR